MPPGLPLYHLDLLLPSYRLPADAAYPGLCPDLEPRLARSLTAPHLLPASTPLWITTQVMCFAGLLDVSLPIRMFSSFLLAHSIVIGALELGLPVADLMD